MKKQELIFLLTPFLLTAVLIVVGYRILVSRTPEARVSLPPASTNIEILEDGQIEKILPKNPIPNNMVMAIQPIPQNRIQLAQLIDLSLAAGANAVYFSLPVTINTDYSLTLVGVHDSSEENITRWVRKSISTAHDNGLHVIFAITLNATDVIKDPATFTRNYAQFITKWSKLATEHGATFFSPGLTLNHPLYSELTPAEMSTLLTTVQRQVRVGYSGYLGVGLCCQDQVVAQPNGYTFMVLIPTAEFSVVDLVPLASQLKAANRMSFLFEYDRDGQRVTSIQP